LPSEIEVANKYEVRFTVKPPKSVERWSTFSSRHGISRKWYRILDETGGWTARHWWVCPEVIDHDRWIELQIFGITIPRDSEIDLDVLRERAFGKELAA
jgi:hypothetical protein